MKTEPILNFTSNEMNLIYEAMNGVLLSADYNNCPTRDGLNGNVYHNVIQHNVMDAIHYGKLDEKYEIDQIELYEKFQKMSKNDYELLKNKITEPKTLKIMETEETTIVHHFIVTSEGNDDNFGVVGFSDYKVLTEEVVRKSKHLITLLSEEHCGSEIKITTMDFHQEEIYIRYKTDEDDFEQELEVKLESTYVYSPWRLNGESEKL